MKPKMNKLGIHIITILTGIMILIASSCKKKDDISNPDPVIPPTNTVNIPGKLPDILHQHEKASGQGLSAYEHYLVGHGLYHSRIFGGANGVGEFPYFDIVELGWDIYKEAKGDSQQEAEYNNISNQLTTIENELNTINTNLQALAAALSLDFTKLENFAMAEAAQTYFNNIGDLYSSTSNNGLAYFAQTAQSIKNGTSGTSWNDLNIFWDQFATNANNNTSGAVASITGLYGLICPNSTELQDGLLAKFAVQVVETSNGPAQQYGNVKNTLGLLENYFTTIINYQFQAVTVYGNVVNKIDTSGSTFNAYLNGTFRQQIMGEIAAYIKAVDFISVNLIDFRNQNQFGADMPFMQIGMAPDTTLLDGLARSRFIAALLMQAVNLKYSVVNGTILTPYNLTNGRSTPVTSISGSIDNSNAFTATAEQYLSIYPYTQWADSTASPDNTWNFYSIGDTNLAMSGGEHTVLLSSSDFFHPWRHEMPIQGTVKVMYYNPNQPDQATATTSPTTTNTMAFGFLSWNWYWGYLRLSMGEESESYWPLIMGFMACNCPGVNPTTQNIIWTDPGNKFVFPAFSWPTPSPLNTPPPFMNNLTMKGSAAPNPGTDGGIDAGRTIGIQYCVSPPPGGGSSFKMLHLNNVYILAVSPPGLNMNVTAYGNRSLYSGSFNSVTTFNFTNEPGFVTGFYNTMSDEITMTSQDTYVDLYVLEAWDNNAKGWPASYIDYELRWGTQYCYMNTYNIFQAP
ncbi:MAG: hypothetical protein WCL03_05445 [Bacteroidota bacterium]